MNYLQYSITSQKILNHLNVQSRKIWCIRSPKRHCRTKLRNARFEKGLLDRINEMLGDFNRVDEEALSHDVSQRILDRANHALNHEFNCLGSGWISNQDLDWHSDLIRHFTWPVGLFYTNYSRKTPMEGADIKFPWELSRCHHLLWLGEAYLLTKDKRYAQEVVNQIIHWISHNPLMYSINWTCAMDVAIRAINWIFALNMIRNADVLTETSIKFINDSLFEHGFFVEHNLEKGIPFSNNHYGADLCGLVFLGQLFSDTKDGKRWLKWAKPELYMEIRNVILPSGVHYEKSISYHRLMIELLFYPLYLLEQSGHSIPSDLWARLKKMFEIVYWYTKDDGMAPQFADSDNGRLLPFDAEDDFRDHRFFLALAHRLFPDDTRFQTHKRDFFIGLDFLTLKGIHTTPNEIKKEQNAICLNDAGWAIVRDAGFFLMTTATTECKYSDSTSSCWRNIHIHADMLSFEWQLDGMDVLVDPGTFAYTGDKFARNLFRGTAKHNTLTIDDKNQFELSSSNMFWGRDFPQCESWNIIQLPDGWELSGGYCKIHDGNNKLYHHRLFRFIRKAKKLTIRDDVSITGTHQVLLHWHFAPEWDIVDSDKSWQIKRGNMNLKMQCRSMEPIRSTILNDTISPSYGIQINAKTLQQAACFIDSFSIENNITWDSQK